MTSSEGGPTGHYEFDAPADRATQPPQRPYTDSQQTLAIIGTVIAPFISLIVAINLLGSTTDSSRQAQLKRWRNFSAIWLGIGVLIAIVALIAISSAVSSASGGGSSGCRGGRDLLTPPSYQSSDGKTWTATYDCVYGGSTTVPVPASEVPGGGQP